MPVLKTQWLIINRVRRSGYEWPDGRFYSEAEARALCEKRTRIDGENMLYYPFKIAVVGREPEPNV